MNDAVRVPTDGLLTTTDLAALPDFALRLAVVSPSTRTVSGPGGTADVEPRVMQVLVVLAESLGQVVTRASLFERCWGGVYVGDDSLNRAVGAVRKLAADIGGGSFEVETIPRTGYRLNSATVEKLGGADPVGSGGISRRGMIGGAAGIAALATAGSWWWIRSREDRHFDQLIQKAEDAIQNEDVGPTVLGPLEEAVSMRPGSAKAWGLLAFFNIITAQLADPKDAPRMIERAKEAALRALTIDPQEPNALLAMFELQGSTLDWFARDQRLRRIIAIDPTRVWAIAELVLMLQAAGLTRESWMWNERAISLVPLSLDFLSKRGLKLWISGKVAEADKVVDQVRALYPTVAWAWFCRFLIFAMTGRANAAQAMLQANPKMISTGLEMDMWRAALPALDRPSASEIPRIREACFEAAKGAGETHGQGVIILSRVGDIDGAFAIAEGALLGRGPIIHQAASATKSAFEDAIDRVNMQWIWTPPCAVMRADPRFGPLCDAIGLTEYWRRRGVQPDYRATER